MPNPQQNINIPKCEDDIVKMSFHKILDEEISVPILLEVGQQGYAISPILGMDACNFKDLTISNKCRCLPST